MVPNAPRWTLRDLVMSYASRLRFPKLFALTAVLFLLDLIFPDMKERENDNVRHYG
jgi:hypothetical protein